MFYQRGVFVVLGDEPNHVLFPGIPSGVILVQHPVPKQQRNLFITTLASSDFFLPFSSVLPEPTAGSAASNVPALSGSSVDLSRKAAPETCSKHILLRSIPSGIVVFPGGSWQPHCFHFDVSVLALLLIQATLVIVRNPQSVPLGVPFPDASLNVVHILANVCTFERIRCDAPSSCHVPYHVFVFWW